MTHLNVGDTAPDFTLPRDGGENISLSDFKGKKVLIYFYPKDDTPGCTKQACALRDELPNLEAENVAVIGISKDNVTKHDKFITKHGLNFPLASDEESDVCERYGVWKEKSIYGKTYMGIERTSFLLDGNGEITHIWSKVKVPDHIQNIHDALSELHKAA